MLASPIHSYKKLSLDVTIAPSALEPINLNLTLFRTQQATYLNRFNATPLSPPLQLLTPSVST